MTELKTRIAKLANHMCKEQGIKGQLQRSEVEESILNAYYKCTDEQKLEMIKQWDKLGL